MSVPLGTARGPSTRSVTAAFQTALCHTGLSCPMFREGRWYRMHRDALFIVSRWMPCGYFLSEVRHSEKRGKYCVMISLIT